MIKKLETIHRFDLPLKESLFVKQKLIECLLYLQKTEEAANYLKLIPESELELESSPFYFLKACLMASEGFVEQAEKRLHRRSERFLPQSFCLIDAYFLGGADWKKKWKKEAFFWEKIQLLKQLILFYKSSKLEKEVQSFHKKLSQEFYHVRTEYPHP